ncbi:DUF3656 domain-containing protein, partial [bacterium]|nr:DUF3656 domain-containing protein [bacterium]
PLNLKDNSAYFDLKELYDAGVDSLKIEGRIKEFEYVYTIVNSWRKQIRSFYENNSLINDNSELYKVFNRDFSNSFLKGDINKEMFIDNPMSYSSKYFSELNNYSSNDKKIKGQTELYEEKEKLRIDIKNKIDQISIAKIPLTVDISGVSGTPLKVSVKTPDTSFIVLSETNLVNAGTDALTRHSRNQRGNAKIISSGSKYLSSKNKKITARSLNYNSIFKRLRALNSTEYYIKNLELENLQSDLFISFKELTSIKKRILSLLNGSKEFSNYSAKNPKSIKKDLTGFFRKNLKNNPICLVCIFWP